MKSCNYDNHKWVYDEKMNGFGQNRICAICGFKECIRGSSMKPVEKYEIILERFNKQREKEQLDNIERRELEGQLKIGCEDYREIEPTILQKDNGMFIMDKDGNCNFLCFQNNKLYMYGEMYECPETVELELEYGQLAPIVNFFMETCHFDGKGVPVTRTEKEDFTTKANDKIASLEIQLNNKIYELDLLKKKYDELLDANKTYYEDIRKMKDAIAPFVDYDDPRDE